MIGTGPYKLTKFTPGQQAVFTPEPELLGPEAEERRPDHQLLLEVVDDEARAAEGRDRHGVPDFTPTELTSLAKTKGARGPPGHGVVIRYLVFNVKRTPFNNIAVRKAIAYLMPRQTIATRVYHGTVQPLYSMVPKGLPGPHRRVQDAVRRGPSLAKAKAAEEGRRDDAVPITLWWTPSHYGDASADEYAEIQRALNASGLFKVTLKSAEWAKYSGALGKNYGAFQLGWFPDYPDAEDYTVSFYQTGSFYNNGYSSKTMDELIAKERAAKTDTGSLGVLKQMQMLGAKELPTIPYWQGNMIAVSRKRRPRGSTARSTPRSTCGSGSSRSPSRPLRREGRPAGAPLLRYD